MSSEHYTARRLWWLIVCLTRGLAAFTALYSLLSLTAALLGDAYNQNAWWIDLNFLRGQFPALVQGLLTLALGSYALHVPKHIITRLVIALPLAAGVYAAILNTLEVFRVASQGAITLGFPLPFSFFVALGLLSILVGVLLGHTLLPTQQRPGKGKELATITLSFALTLILFPLGQIYCFGTTDYRVKVDAAVVFGAHVYPNGRPSPPLQDRLDTAIQFYHDGYTPLLVMSGGIDGDGVSEAAAMRDYAVAHGVPAGDIVLDEYGSNTKKTARNTVKTLRADGFTKVATVSNFYHLA
ncbi:MAG: YdcF family protein, partial [Coriobacteriales bacterium]|nr:YdcF family protein [Coriobacteriales bacterium]